MKFLILTGIVLFTISGCRYNRTFERYQTIKDKNWHYEDVIPFELEIPDTVSNYAVYMKIRLEKEFSYKNIWVLAHITSPSGKKRTEKLNIRLADKKGYWYGGGVDDIIDIEDRIGDHAGWFTEKGKYRIEIEQNMRYNPVEHILSIGLKVEKMPKELRKNKNGASA